MMICHVLDSGITAAATAEGSGARRTGPGRGHGRRNAVAVIFLFFMTITAWPEDVLLSDFPRGKWLDPHWKAYWALGETSLRLLDVKDKVIWDFAGIVSDMRVETLDNGDRRLTFACQAAGRSYEFLRTTRGAMRMTIRRFGSEAAYSVEMPTVSEQQLRDYKQAVISKRDVEAEALVSGLLSTQAEVATAPPARQAESSHTASTFQDLLDRAAASEPERMEATLEELAAGGRLDEAIDALESLASSPDAPPSVFLALSAAYGRKGLRTQEYAALLAAERAPVPPGATFNVSVLYGRKDLLASRADAREFMVGAVDILSRTPGAEAELDGTPAGCLPLSLAKLAAGSHRLAVRAAGYEDWSFDFMLEVGERRRFEPDLAPLPTPAREPLFLPRRTISVDGSADDWAGLDPILVGPASKRLSMPGTDLRSVYLAADEDYWYVRMDFGNGLFSPGGARKKEQVLELTADVADRQQQYLQLKMVSHRGALVPTLTVLVRKNAISVIVREVQLTDEYKASTQVLEMRFPVKELAQYLRGTEVSEARAIVYDGSAIPAVTTSSARLRLR